MERVSRRYIPEKMLFDVRLIERNLRDGFITRKELEKHLESLPDVEKACVPIETKTLGLAVDENEGGQEA